MKKGTGGLQQVASVNGAAVGTPVVFSVQPVVVQSPDVQAVAACTIQQVRFTTQENHATYFFRMPCLFPNKRFQRYFGHLDTLNQRCNMHTLGFGDLAVLGGGH